MCMKYQIAVLLLGSFLACTVAAETDNLGIGEKRRGDPGLWSIGLENDAFAGPTGDKDYTLGLNLSYTGPATKSFKLNPYHLQRYLDAGMLSQEQPAESQSLEIGFYGFTPDDLNIAEPIRNDRPYASLIYLQSTREFVDQSQKVSWVSSVSLGVLGLDLVGSSQNRVHKAGGNHQAKGWQHQISEGGELTAKYSVARQKSWPSDNPRMEFKTTAQLSLGYLTEFSYGLSVRSGRIHSSWWSFDPELAAYGERSSSFASSNGAPERFAWGGIAVKARAYNVFLQGQFRDSEVTFRSDEIRHLLMEAWLGYTFGFSNGLRISYWLRGHSSEIEDGPGDRNLLWGGMIFSKVF